MPVYCVVYDLHKAGKNDYLGLIEKLKTFPDHCHAEFSVWLLATDWLIPTIKEYLAPHLDPRDNLIVIQLASYWGSKGPCSAIDNETSVPGTVPDWLDKWVAKRTA